MSGMIQFEADDGGRQEAGYKGLTGDCVIRSIAITSGIPYKTVYKELSERQDKFHQELHPNSHYFGTLKKKSVRSGVYTSVWMDYVEELGYKQIPVDSGITSWDDIPKTGKLLIRVPQHLSCVVDGVIHDTWDPFGKHIKNIFVAPSAGDKAEVDDAESVPVFFENQASVIGAKVVSKHSKKRYFIVDLTGKKVAYLTFPKASQKWTLTCIIGDKKVKSIVDHKSGEVLCRHLYMLQEYNNTPF